MAKKFPPNSVFVYDEGRMGLDSKRAMESINKGMEDFFQECGQYNHVILIVLPDFFKLAYDYAITRSMFLLNVGVSKQWHRGRFEFYNRNQKEWLYVLGKRRISSYGKYSSTNSSFFGKFTSWLPFDKDEYNQRKKAALEKKDLTRFQKRFKLQRDASFYIIKNKTILTDKEIAKDMSNICGFEISEDVIEKGILEIKRSIEK